MDRAGGGVRDAVHGQVPEALLPQEPGTQHFTLDDDDSVAELWGSRPDRIATLSGPQERVLRRTVEQIVDAVPLVPLLDDPVPQTVEQLVDVLRFFNTLCPVSEQVIEVPKILPEDVPMRRFCRDTQLVEQLVEVPTTVSYSSLLQRTVEQHVDIPVPVGRGRNAGLQGFLPEQSSTFSFSSSERISERIMEQIVDIPVARGDPQGFRPGQSSSSVAHSPAAWLNTEDGPFQGVFRTFSPAEKSATDTRHMGARVPRHVSSSTSSAYGLRSWVDDDTGETWTLLTDPALGSWWYSLRTHRSQWHPPWER